MDPTIKIKLLSPNAIIPSYAHDGDAGLDISVISVINDTKDVCYYGTGLSIEPPDGYYFEMFARSSLHKKGYSLATGVSVIDASYRGEIIVPLKKEKNDVGLSSSSDLHNKGNPPVVQLVLKHLIRFPVIEVDQLSYTSRNQGGFGSTS